MQKNEDVLCLAEQRPTYFLPARCAYLSHLYFNPLGLLQLQKTCDPPYMYAWQMPKQLHSLTGTILLKGDSRCGRQHTAGFGKIIVPGLLSSAEVALDSYSHPFQQQGRV